MIAGGLKRVFQPPEHIGPLMVDQGGLAVHDLFGMDHLAAECLTNGLVPETHPKDRDPAAEALDHRERDPRLVRCTGPWRDDDVIRGKGLDLFETDLIIA